MKTIKSGKPWGHISSFKKDPLSFLQMAAQNDDEIVSFRLAHKSVRVLVKQVLVSKTTVTALSSTMYLLLTNKDIL
ncbi:hypothetical protein [Halobacillus mangrovi]|uniref:hypothetical protein n=1 Tax=Halobacillus mangrovi TaxID=402384 RepID=UPI003D982415